MKNILKYFPASLFLNLILISILAWLFGLMNYYDWGAGFKRGLVLIAGLVFIVFKNFIKLPQVLERKEIAVLYFISMILIYEQISYFLKFYDSSHPIDVGESTVIALRLFWRSFENPYAHCVDEVEISDPDLFFAGYKYFPLTLFLYSPLVLKLNFKGLFITNLVFHVLTIIYIFKISNYLKNYDMANHPIIPIILYLSSNLVLFELFRQGVNDIIPTLFILMSYYYFLRKNEAISAICLGASISTKWLPGLIFALLLFPQIKNKKLFLLYGGSFFALTVLPFLFWDYKAFVANTIIYFIMKPGDSTGFLFGFNPFWAKTITIIVFILFFLLLFFYYIKHTGTKYAVIFYFTILLTLFILPLKENHRNHLIWLIPLYSLSFNTYHKREALTSHP